MTTARCCRAICPRAHRRYAASSYIAANCYAAISIIDYPERWCAEADADEAVKERIRAGTRARLHRHWEMFADSSALRPALAAAT